MNEKGFFQRLKETDWEKAIFEDLGWKDIFSYGLDGISTIGNSFKEASDATTRSSKYQMQSTIANINSQRAIANIDVIHRTFEEQMNAERLKGEISKGKEKVRESASGFEVGSSSYVDIENQLDYYTQQTVIALNTAYQLSAIENRYQAQMEKIQSDLYQKQAKYELQSAKASKISGIISGLGQIGTAVGMAAGKDAYLSQNKGSK